MSPSEPPVDLSQVRSSFGLPRSTASVAFHPGSVGVWELRTAGGDGFAMKLTTAPADDWTRVQLGRESRLERAAAAAGIALPEVVAPLSPTIGHHTEISGRLVAVHRWVPTLPAGRTVDPAELHRWLGRTLAVLHRVEPVDRAGAVDDVAQAYGVHPMADWEDWVGQAHRRELDWAAAAEGVLGVIAVVTDLVTAALAEPDLSWCLTHRDINPPNVLHTEDGPVLCDFGYAGPDVAWLEAVGTAVSFDAPDVVPAYRAAGGAPGRTGPLALARAVGPAANGLAFAMWLSLGHRAISDSERRDATERVPHLCRDLVDRVDRLDETRVRIFAESGGNSGR